MNKYTVFMRDGSKCTAFAHSELRAKYLAVEYEFAATTDDVVKVYSHGEAAKRADTEYESARRYTSNNSQRRS